MKEEELAFLALAAASEPNPVGADARARFRAALDVDRHLPFCAELARYFALEANVMRGLLRRIDDPAFWIRGASPMEGYLDFQPGPSLRPLRGGFARMLGGMRIQEHRHTDRELTFVLSGELRDGSLRAYGPGSVLDMAAGSVHSVHVAEDKEALVALLNGHIEML